MEDNNLYPLNTTWCLWYHSIEDTSWNKKSYRYLCDITDLYDLKQMNQIIKPHHLQNGMFFLMREGIFPTWEDPDNRNGSCLSFKISGSQLVANWTFIVERVLTEDILKEKDKYNEVNGISISPKKEFNICKLWLRNDKPDYKDYLTEYSPQFDYSRALFKKHDIH
jgi:hypothetical protein